MRAFARKGASTQTIAILATFLSNRTMSVRVKDTWSDPLPVYGGVPQGSILGVLLFNIATDDLEDEDDHDDDFVHTSDEDSFMTAAESPSDLSEEEKEEPPAFPSTDSWSGILESSSGGLSSSVEARLSDLNPLAEEFVPGQQYCRYGEPAPVLSVTDEILGHREEPAGPPSTDSQGLPSSESDLDFESCTSDQNVLTSTPVRNRGRPVLRQSPLRQRGPRLTNRDWSYMPGRRNRRRRRNLQNRINYTDEGELSVPEEINKKKTGLRWKPRKPRNLKYVDDGMTISKMNMDSAVINLPGPVLKPVKDKHDLPSQNLFRRIVRKAESRGMVVNKKKTKVLCVSDAQTYSPTCHLFDADGNRIEAGSKLKVLGFHLDSRPSVHAHIDALKLFGCFAT